MGEGSSGMCLKHCSDLEQFLFEKFHLQNVRKERPLPESICIEILQDQFEIRQMKRKQLSADSFHNSFAAVVYRPPMVFPHHLTLHGF